MSFLPKDSHNPPYTTCSFLTYRFLMFWQWLFHRNNMSFLPKNGENDMSYDIVFYLRMSLFWPCFRPVCPYYWPVSKIIIRTPKLMISNSKMLEIPLLKHQNWPKNSKFRVKIQSSWTQTTKMEKLFFTTRQRHNLSLIPNVNHIKRPNHVSKPHETIRTMQNKNT